LVPRGTRAGGCVNALCHVLMTNGSRP